MSELTNDDCAKIADQFAEITKTDVACAHFFLQDTNWKLEPALERFFSYVEGGLKDDSDDEHKNLGTSDEKNIQTQSDISNASSACIKFKPITLLSWNIDGLDTIDRAPRILKVLEVIKRLHPDVIFFQEVTTDIVEKMKGTLGGPYNIFVARSDMPYFTMVLVNSEYDFISHKDYIYKKTSMFRSMQCVHVRIRGTDVRLLNTHLESTKDQSETRKQQLDECFELLREWDDHKSVIIFGGDLNLRDSEVGELPAGLQDAWEAAGSNFKNRFTWDMRINDNSSLRGPRCRFDRIYFKSNEQIKKVEFFLDGQSRASCGRYPSDHWAVVVRFSGEN